MSEPYRREWGHAVGASGTMNIERRFKARYPVELNVRYQTYGQTTPVSGVGRTINFSSSGVLVAASETVADGARLKLVIEWPSLLNGTTPLQLITLGRVVRSSASGFAVALEHYQFRTMKRSAKGLASGVAAALTVAGEVPPPVRPPRIATAAQEAAEMTSRGEVFAPR
jgi:hypothetical protein